MKNLKVQVATSYKTLNTFFGSVAATCTISIFILFCLTLFSCSGKGEKAVESNNPVEPVSASNYEDNFIGEWESVNSKNRNHMIITRNGKNFIIQEGKTSSPGIYDEENKIIKINVGAPLDIMFLEDENMILVSGAGQYTKVIKE